ncbi:hypothetical protein T484DRAFT_1783724, partial [Baffinella frigidus]
MAAGAMSAPQGLFLALFTLALASSFPPVTSFPPVGAATALAGAAGGSVRRALSGRRAPASRQQEGAILLEKCSVGGLASVALLHGPRCRSGVTTTLRAGVGALGEVDGKWDDEMALEEEGELEGELEDVADGAAPRPHIPVVHMEERFCVISKPGGMLVHRNREINKEDRVFLLQTLRDQLGRQ